ncbi:epoxide hydrolase [Novosphingobium sp. PC22D]|uniref:epoxide hydrolase family protein n=1 Tax=Novosphingobium sp. PC22D TaxID=1962403 RepID=UPI000BEFE8E6|nr:epoxide hydrolase family protein [Novosphingobium sp. PC22D]PEQ11086.1 epoxide hydrolase [Novosphingobium sp. PC22D]
MPQIRPFPLSIAPERIDDLHRRLDHARWPEKETVDDWSQGTPLADLRDLAAWWRRGYDWRAFEARLNALGQFVTEIDGLDIHFLDIRSPHEDALPLVMTHGWPGSVVEFMRVIGPLTDPVAHGGRAEDAFHLVIPSLPGYGFSQRPDAPGWGVERIARAWAELMRRLGHRRWAAQGGDWGAFVTNAIGGQAPEGCIGIHVNMPIAGPTEAAKANPGPEDRRAFERMAYYRDFDGGYAKIQGTRPQSLGYGLVDSPVGLAGWILEKLHGWSDNAGDVFAALGRDAVLDNIMLYWLPGTGASAARLYWESFGKTKPPQIAIPAGVSVFPGDILPAPRPWVDRRVTNLVYWNELDSGGHFAAWEKPEAFVAELRACFALMR